MVKAFELTGRVRRAHHLTGLTVLESVRTAHPTG